METLAFAGGYGFSLFFYYYDIVFCFFWAPFVLRQGEIPWPFHIAPFKPKKLIWRMLMRSYMKTFPALTFFSWLWNWVYTTSSTRSSLTPQTVECMLWAGVDPMSFCCTAPRRSCSTTQLNFMIAWCNMCQGPVLARAQMTCSFCRTMMFRCTWLTWHVCGAYFWGTWCQTGVCSSPMMKGCAWNAMSSNSALWIFFRGCVHSICTLTTAPTVFHCQFFKNILLIIKLLAV